ncbi:MAG: EAL domain-containing protein [Siculibacillus sp.]|nr:EAL domain-containing protein [Siculibacillus sp.]
MSSRSIGRLFRPNASTRLHGTRYAVALAVLFALTISSFLIMRDFVVDERALDTTMSSIEELRAELATHQIAMHDLVTEMRRPDPDEIRLRGLRRALAASRDRLTADRAILVRAMQRSEVGASAWLVLSDPPYSLDNIIADMTTDARVALAESAPAPDEDLPLLADPREDGFLSITDSHASAARLASERLRAELRTEAEARKVWREQMHTWLGWATVLVLIGEAAIIFWPLLGNLGRESERADAAQNELTRLARHDVLTGLLNRASLIDAIEREIDAADPEFDRMAVLLIDLDRFKPINDTFGHAAGDAVLIEMARRIQASLRPGDVVARLGGDEFVVLLPRSGSSHEVREIGLRIKRSLGRVMEIEGHRFELGGSVGCAVWPADARDVDGLLSAADLAMYNAKRSGRDEPVFYDEKLRKAVAQVRSEEAELRRAIGENELVLHYQPMVSRDGSKLHGFEALVRWNHPTRGLIDPDGFLPTADRAGLMSQITAWVVDHACRQHAAWTAAGFAPGSMSINMTRSFLSQPDVIGQVLAIAETHAVAPSSLVLEVSERVMSEEDRTPIAPLLAMAHGAGLRIAVDEFGLGQASLIHLRRPEIDILKIDRAFVRDLASAPENAAIVGAMIELARILDKQVVIEGVETADQLALLAISDRAWVQGFLYSRPLEASAAAAFMVRLDERAKPRLRAAG